ncbi:ArsR/SmtB family transcription factor [Fusibacter ferrireducens]|uniref:Winged helix-turn-helix transcriptional regulator n=1 Tax=Fusibacter ferrireducens TaxID=2785058 RepID=A0ABR9ZSI0_9FIRM|nr:metalloregulator ArsR/SmtB family transcription factor [Fusibacter ferrireducens]MBF4693078.1 winged helix-turn-helix transcriptional regulator [Fusibacter ferrireducens]
MTEQKICKCSLVLDEAIRDGINIVLENDMASSVADIFKVFGDPTRIKILYLLITSELCVQAISSSLDMTQSAISHQLRVLKQAGLVKNRKEGKVVYYSLDDDHVLTILTQGIDHVIHK